jgi:hypothetical protein
MEIGFTLSKLNLSGVPIPSASHIGTVVLGDFASFLFARE